MKDNFDFAAILADFGIGSGCEVKPLGDGLINHTYCVSDGDKPLYVLQQINTDIFTDVDMLQDNIGKVTSVLAASGKLTLHFIAAASTGKTYARHGGAVWRVSDYIANSRTISEVTPETARMTGRGIRSWRDLASLPRYGVPSGAV